MREEDLIRMVTQEVVQQLSNHSAGQQKTLPIALSNRHLHLSQEHLERLFGPGYQLTKLKDLSQPGQFAAKETVRLIGPKGVLEKVRILGPTRGETQIELSLGDGYTLGVKPPVRASGDLTGTPGCLIAGPQGYVELTYGIICAQRHIHMAPEDGVRFGVQDKEMVQIRCGGERGLIFDQTLVRISPKYRLEMHVDVEEGNAAGLKNGDMVEIIKGV